MKKKVISVLVLVLCLGLIAAFGVACDDGDNTEQVAYYYDIETKEVKSVNGDAVQPYNLSFNETAAKATVTGVNESAFRGTLDIPELVRYGKDGEIYPVAEIAYKAFQNDLALTKVTIPSRMRKIGANAFDGCLGLNEIAFAGEPENLALGSFSFANTGLASLTLAKGVTSIGSNAFEDCVSLVSVSFPSSLTEIGLNAFAGCTSLSAVNIPVSVNILGNKAFEGCTSLSSVTIAANGISELKEGVFLNCTSLTALNIPQGVRTIGMDALRGCTNLSSVTIPITVTEIRNRAFHGCTSLESISLPFTLESFGGYVFSECTALTEINFDESKEAFLAIVENAADWNDDSHSLTVNCSDGALEFRGTVHK